nr:heavy metal-associated isoprenylated plant protein 47 [Tanacetum cinerariifolium]
MARQKMVLEVAMRCKTCQTKALQIVAETRGVESVALEGEDSLKNQVVVIGTGVDVTGLTKILRKKVGHTEIKIVSDVEEDDD